MKNKGTEELTTILKKAIGSKIYGSVEIYFESGTITQITQRIIKKISKPAAIKNSSNSNPPQKKTSNHHNPNLETTTTLRPI